MKRIILFLLVTFIAVSCTKPTGEMKDSYKKGSVVFIHPDGTGLADWHAARLLYKGPDGELNWDKMTDMGLYKAHIRNTLVSSSNAGATIHAYGNKADYYDFGETDGKKVTALSGKKLSILEEAVEAGLKTGLVNSGSIIEPGTAVFASHSEKRGNYDDITEQVIKSGADVILSGGEDHMLPEGTKGRFTESGKRKDGKNLIEWAKENGYTVVYNAEELNSLPENTEKVLGVFAEVHTFNDKTEEDQRKEGISNFNADAPTLAEMTEAALKILSADGKRFFLVVEEEATDNMGNKNNANGKLEALKRADDAIGVVEDFIDENGNTLLVTAADSEAGGPEVYAFPGNIMDPGKNLADTTGNGAPLDGINGTGTKPFISKPDANGKTWPFGIAWSGYADMYGSVVAKAYGVNSTLMHGTIDNTYIYKIMYVTLFGVEPGPEN